MPKALFTSLCQKSNSGPPSFTYAHTTHINPQHIGGFVKLLGVGGLSLWLASLLLVRRTRLGPIGEEHDEPAAEMQDRNIMVAKEARERDDHQW